MRASNYCHKSNAIDSNQNFIFHYLKIPYCPLPDMALPTLINNLHTQSNITFTITIINR